jgi:chaperonin GroEL
MREKKDRAEDALHACQAAIAGGILPGGGVALAEASMRLDDLTLPGEENLGVQILRRALEEPIRLIAGNAGRSGEAVAAKVRGLPSGWGYNAAEDSYVDMLAAGIVDPAEVTRTALSNAVSIAALVINTEGLIIRQFESIPPLIPTADMI